MKKSCYVTAKEIKKLDELAIKSHGIPSLVLMENAGRAVSEIILRQLRGRKNPSVVIVCGIGNNAGDGFVVARYLADAGIGVIIYVLANPQDLKADAATNYAILEKIRFPEVKIKRTFSTFAENLKKADIVVDAIFGVGLNRALTDPYKSVIDQINKYARNVVSVDIPSGLDATTGKIYEVCVKAKTTVTFSFPKIGFITNDGPRFVGQVKVVNIGIPKILKKLIFVEIDRN